MLEGGFLPFPGPPRVLRTSGGRESKDRSQPLLDQLSLIGEAGTCPQVSGTENDAGGKLGPSNFWEEIRREQLLRQEIQTVNLRMEASAKSQGKGNRQINKAP